ncbi:MAG: pseudouridine-5'-phosphate glycosidase [Acidimicrobiia bacterium]
MSNQNRVFAVAPEVQRAVDAGAPVVALESAIITHGLPAPTNLVTARMLESEIRHRGATPATVAVVDGAVRIGLDDEELERVASVGSAGKAAARDIAAVVASGGTSGTTVSATVFCAAGAGIRVMATGGIGGVHRAANETWDVSSDLTELSRSDVAVVCAGAKAILDLPRTHEMLETLGILVIGYRTSEFPAFYSRTSGLAVGHRADSVAEVAAVLRAMQRIGAGRGALVVNPIPESGEIPRAEIEALVEDAVDAAASGGVGGKHLTPYLLDRLLAASQGRTVEANVALVRHNARVAADIAVELAGGRGDR